MSDKAFNILAWIIALAIIAIIVFWFYVAISRWIECRQYYGVPAGDVPAQCIGKVT